MRGGVNGVEERQYEVRDVRLVCEKWCVCWRYEISQRYLIRLRRAWGVGELSFSRGGRGGRD